MENRKFSSVLLSKKDLDNMAINDKKSNVSFSGILFSKKVTDNTEAEWTDFKTVIVSKDKDISDEERRLIAMDDRIDSYITGKMSPGEERSFLEDCHKDPELKERAYTTAMLVKVLKQMK